MEMPTKRVKLVPTSLETLYSFAVTSTAALKMLLENVTHIVIELNNTVMSHFLAGAKFCGFSGSLGPFHSTRLGSFGMGAVGADCDAFSVYSPELFWRKNPFGPALLEVDILVNRLCTNCYPRIEMEPSRDSKCVRNGFSTFLLKFASFPDGSLTST